MTDNLPDNIIGTLLDGTEEDVARLVNNPEIKAAVEAAAVIQLDADGVPTGLSDTEIDALKVAASDLVDSIAENEQFHTVPNREAKRRHFNGFQSIQLNRSRIRRSRHRIRKQHIA